MALSLHSFVAKKIFFIVQLNFIASFLFAKVFADPEDVVYYDVTANRYISLEHSSHAFIQVNGTVFMQNYKNTNDSILINVMFQNSGIEFGQNKKINYTECKSFEGYNESFLHPFVVTINANGTFKHMLVHKDEQLIMINLKLLFAAFLQNQIVKLFQESKNISFETKETIIYGTCDVEYIGSNLLLPSKAENLRVKKIYDMKSCSGVDDTHVKNKYDYCNTESEEDLKWNLESFLERQSRSDFSVFSAMSEDERLSFKPFKNDPVTLSINQKTAADVLFLPIKAPIIEFDEENSKIVTANYLVPVNETLLNDTNTENQELREIYKALSCYKADQSLYLDYVAHFLQCNS